MHAVITAGSKPASDDPLYEYTRGRYKALIEIAGKPMIQWILDALSGSKMIESIVIVGLPPFTNLHCEHPMIILEDQGGLLENNRAGVQELLKVYPQAEHAMLLTSDVPGITTEMVDWVAAAMLGCEHEFLYPVIERSVMERRFPGSRRTYLKLKDHEVCGGDVMGIRTALMARDNPVWEKMIQTRKNPIQQAAILGFDTLFLILLRQLSLEEAVKSIGKRLGIHARGLLCPYAEIGMDVDKPNQLQLMEAELTKVRGL